MNQKSSKNQPKIDQKETENPPKNQTTTKNHSWRGPGGTLKALGGQYRDMRGGNPFFGAMLGPSWRPVGPSWRPLGPVLAVMAASWARLEPLLAAEIGPQVDQISTQQSIRTLMPLRIDFWEDSKGILGGKMEASWVQNRNKNRSQL